MTWHALRHTFASRLVAAGVDLRTVQELGGWRTLSMVQRYAHLSPGHLVAAVEKIVAVPGGRERSRTSAKLRLGEDSVSRVRGETLDKLAAELSRRGGRARLKASDSKSDRGPEGPSGVQILSPPPNFLMQGGVTERRGAVRGHVHLP